MEHATALAREHGLLAAARAVLPDVATALAVMLDQSMRRPSLARIVVQSLQSVS
ncbi:hypothetical protein [uncultured Ramlibacter sp.]|uniref:hypothetical protein n=1 Tax=uncultured Ramlibacter sp. TaxID=260755 RepID=UPI002612938A|nr:hypothetical protein [uncultured Ramlibacter sp.]